MPMVFGLGKHGPDGVYGVVMIIGSGSVRVAIVASDPTADTYEIVWSYTERTYVHPARTSQGSEKGIITALMNATLELGSAGVRSLKNHDPLGKIGSVHAHFTAPWSHTLSTGASIVRPEPFLITPDIIDELIEVTKKQARDRYESLKESGEINLTLITQKTLRVLENGYEVKHLRKNQVTEVALTELIGLVRSALHTAWSDAIESILPEVPRFAYTFMDTLNVVREVHAQSLAHAILADITAEATEVCVVHDGIPVHTTSIPIGLYTLARRISALMNISHEEALGYFRENQTNIFLAASEEKKLAIEQMNLEYRATLTELFIRDYGDTLRLPSVVFVRNEALTDRYFGDGLKHAIEVSGTPNIDVRSILSLWFPETGSIDPALSLAASVFHKRLHERVPFTR